MGVPQAYAAQSQCYMFGLLDPPAGTSTSAAIAVNNAGQIVGSAGVGPAPGHAVLWDATGVAHDLGTLGEQYSTADAISQSGLVAGLAWNVAPGGVKESRMFVYRDGQLTDAGTVDEFTRC